MKNISVFSEKFPVYSVLNAGKDRALSRDNLKSIFKVNDRELFRQIESERKSGKPILSNKKGGGYYKPETKKEVEDFLRVLKKAIVTMAQEYLAITKEVLKRSNQGAEQDLTQYNIFTIISEKEEEAKNE